MNNPNPLSPQSSILEQKQKTRSRVKLAVFFVLAAHLALFSVLLIQGCKREEAPSTQPLMDTNAMPSFVDTNAPGTNVDMGMPPAGTNVVETTNITTMTTAPDNVTP